MADMSIFNPIEPQDGFRGAMHGYEYYKADQARAQAQRHVLEQMMLEAEKRRLENTRYGQETPHILTQQEHKGVQEQGRGLEAMAKGREAQATWRGRADTSNIQNLVLGLESTGRALELAAASSPMMAEAEYQNWKRSLPPQFQSVMPQHWGPDVSVGIKALSDQIKNSHAHRRSQDELNIKGQYDLDKQREANRGARDVAEITAQGRVDAAKLRPDTKLKLENLLAEKAEKIARGEPLTPAEQRSVEWAQSILYNRTNSAIDPNALILWMLGGGMGSGQTPPGPRTPSPVPAPNPNAPSQAAPPGSPQNPIVIPPRK